MTKKEIQEIIDLFLSRKSNNTQKNYIRSFHKFFNLILHKNTQDITWSDLEKIKYSDLITYVNLLEQSYKNYNTIDFYISSLKALFKMFKNENSKINLTFEGIEPKKELIKNINTYGSFTRDEINDLFMYSKSKNQTMYLFFKILFVTAHRVNSILNIKFNDIEIKKIDDNSFYILKVFDKTDYFETPLPKDLFLEIETYVKNNECVDEKIFQFSNKTVERFLIKFCDDNDIDRLNRKLTIHSIKKTSGDIAYEMTRNVYKVADHLHHKNIDTAYQHYINKNKDLNNSLSIQMLDYIDEDSFNEDLLTKLKSMSKSEIINTILNLDLQTKRIVSEKL